MSSRCFLGMCFLNVEMSDQLGLQGSLGRGDVFWSLRKMSVRTLLRAPSRSLPEGFRLHHSQLLKLTKLKAASYQAWSIIKHRILIVFARIARAWVLACFLLYFVAGLWPVLRGLHKNLRINSEIVDFEDRNGRLPFKNPQATCARAFLRRRRPLRPQSRTS